MKQPFFEFIQQYLQDLGSYGSIARVAAADMNFPRNERNPDVVLFYMLSLDGYKKYPVTCMQLYNRYKSS